MKTETLTEAGRRRLAHAPIEWEKMPFFGDGRPNGRLIKAGYVEIRHIDVTPDNWGSGPIRVIREEWRITPAGRAALQENQDG